MSFTSALFGKPGQIKSYDKFNQPQMQAQSQLLQQGLGGLQSNLSFDPIRQNAMRSFQSKTIPTLLERLEGFGGEGALRSSALGQQLGGAASDLESQLAAQESQFNLSKLGPLLQMLGIGLQPQKEHYYQPGSRGLLGGIGESLSSAIPLAASAAGSYMTGGSSTAIPALMALLGSRSNASQASTGPQYMSNQQFNPGFAQPNQQFNARSLYRATGQFPSYNYPIGTGSLPNMF